MKLGRKITTFQSKSGKKVLVRTITWDDLDDLLEFANNLIKEDTFVMLSGKELTREEEIDYLADSIKNVAKGKKIHLIAEIDGKLGGSAEIRFLERRSAHVGNVGISIGHTFRDEGIGTQLLEILIAQGKKAGLRVLTLTLFAINKRAERVYEKLGFKKAGVVPKVYLYKDTYVDELTMHLPLV